MLSTPDRTAVSEAFSRLEAAAARASSSTSGVMATLRSAWGSLIGAGSAVSAAEEDARQTVKQVPIFERRLEELLASDTATHLEAEAFVADVAPFADITGLLATTEQLGAGAFVDQVVEPAIDDLVKPIIASGRGWLAIVAWLPWIVLGLVIVAVWRVASKAGAGVGDAARTAAGAAAARWKAKP